MLWHPKTLQNLAMYNVFFHFWPFFHCRKATKMTQNSISIPSCAQTPKNPRKMPPPPAKADIATAILTNGIEHLVLLFCPPISTPSPPKRCGRILQEKTLQIQCKYRFNRQYAATILPTTGREIQRNNVATRI